MVGCCWVQVLSSNCVNSSLVSFASLTIFRSSFRTKFFSSMDWHYGDSSVWMFQDDVAAVFSGDFEAQNEKRFYYFSRWKSFKFHFDGTSTNWIPMSSLPVFGLCPSASRYASMASLVLSVSLSSVFA